MQAARPGSDGTATPVRISNRTGRSPVILLCDHASNDIPAEFGTLGLDRADLDRHIAWDPGALPVAERMMERLDAPLVASTVSRLVIDCNRAPEAVDAIPEKSEGTVVPGNRGIGEVERRHRAALAHMPYHDAIDALVDERAGRDSAPVFLAIHTFTPVYLGRSRPWHIGIIHDDDERLSAPMAARLGEHRDLVVGLNEPYSPGDGVYYTLTRHASSRGFQAAMIEIRNDLVATPDRQQWWGDLLSEIVSGILADQEREAPEKATKTMLTN
jgi:predicted N-formylglutamate amidohydrolase